MTTADHDAAKADAQVQRSIMGGTAILSPCGTYRYVLTRRIPCMLRWLRPCLFVMLNPSTADAAVNDATIRRCIGFATAWQCTSLTVVNLFGLRATNPAELAAHADPFGPDNAHHVSEQIINCQMGVIVAAWGAHPMAGNKYESTGVLKRALVQSGAQCLGMTKDGSPKHPLYIRADQQPIPWRPA